MMKARKCNESSYGDLIVDIGCLFINKPYHSGTLEGYGKEKLIVNVSTFDCTTFVETVLALARCSSDKKFSKTDFRKNLKLIRYRQGTIKGYSSRLHYFTDWLRDNEKKGLLIDITKNSGGKLQNKKINFMTAHKELYPTLRNKVQLSEMSEIEKNLFRKSFHVISKDKLKSQKEKIQNGDIIAFAANEEGLDVSHVGFAIRNEKSLRLLHASQKEGKVVISKKTLVDYLKSNKKFTGILIARSL